MDNHDQNKYTTLASRVEAANRHGAMRVRSAFMGILGLMLLQIVACQSTSERQCGPNFTLYKGLCYNMTGETATLPEAPRMCARYSTRLPSVNELADFCQVSRGLPNFTRNPGDIATEYWTADGQGNDAFVLATNCQAQRTQLPLAQVRPKFFICVKEMAPEPQAE